MDTVVTAWRQSGSIRHPEALRGWLLRVATRLSLSRRRRRRPMVALAVHEQPYALPEDAERVALMDALGRLPPAMRAAVALHYLADLTVDEVATALGRSRNTVKAQLRVALQRLRTSLGGDQSARGEAGVHAV